MSVVMSGGRAANSIDEVRRSLTGKGGLLVPLLIGAALLAVGYVLAKRQAGERLV
jgi:hypothetical protein